MNSAHPTFDGPPNPTPWPRPASEVLRCAAALMRERAEAATPGPWRLVEGENEYDWPIEGGPPEYDYLCVSPDDGVRGGHSRADAVHIASWHPAVALAVADWLGDEADRVDDNIATYRPAEARFDTESAWVERNHRAALAVARAYLGESA